GLEGHDAFAAAVEAELQRARFFRRELSVLVVRAARRSDAALVTWCPRVRALLRPVDRAALYGGDTIEILLPEAGASEAATLAHAIVASNAGEPALVCGIAGFP